MEAPSFLRLTWYVMLMLWSKYFLEFVLAILHTYVFVWNHEETSQLTTAVAEWLVPLWYHMEHTIRYVFKRDQNDVNLTNFYSF